MQQESNCNCFIPKEKDTTTTIDTFIPTFFSNCMVSNDRKVYKNYRDELLNVLWYVSRRSWHCTHYVTFKISDWFRIIGELLQAEDVDFSRIIRFEKIYRGGVGWKVSLWVGVRAELFFTWLFILSLAIFKNLPLFHYFHCFTDVRKHFLLFL